MLDHVTDLVPRGLIPAVVVKPRVDQKNIPFFNFHPFLHHLGGVDIVVGTNIRKIDDSPFVDQKVHIQAGNILSRGIEVNFPVQVGSDMIRVGHHLTIGPVGGKSFKVLYLQGYIRRPRRSSHTQGDC